MDQALAGLKLLDLSQTVAGAYCTKLLADYGAEVIKIEKPGEGDSLRGEGPFFHDEPHPEKSGTFLHLNTNKKSITLNLEAHTGKRIFRELVRDADVVIEDFEPGTMAGLGLDYESLERINPKLIMTSISFFGQTGPYRDYKGGEIVAWALSGYMSMTGDSDREPLKVYGNQAQYQAGLHATMAILMAQYQTMTTGIGQHIDISVLESIAHQIVGAQATTFVTGRLYKRVGCRISTPSPTAPYPTTFLPCKDGYIHLHYVPRHPETLALLVEEPKLAEPRIVNEPRGHADEIDELCLPWLMQHTKEEVFHRAQELRSASTPIYSMDEVFANEHLHDREYFCEIDHPVVGKLTYPGAPFKMTATPWQAGRAPLLGEHNEEIYCQRLHYSKDDLVKLRERGII